MKKVTGKCSLIFAAIIVSVSAMAQSDVNAAKAFKDIHIQDTDPRWEQEIKKKELQKAPSLLYIDKANSTFILKKNKYRRKKI